MVSGSHQSTNPKYQLARLESELQCGRLSTPKNTHLEILQDGMDNTRRGVAPAPHWIIPPERFTGLHNRLTDLTPRMIQKLGQGTKIKTIDIMNITPEKIKSRWIRRGIRPEMDDSRLKDPLVQPWTYIEQLGTPQQDCFTNTTETRLACGIYTVLSSLYAVRN